MKTYSEKRQDPRWQQKRLRILELANWMCHDCGANTTGLQVHHCIYLPGYQPWDYPDELLLSLCDKCHEFRQSRETDCHIRLARHLRTKPPHMLDVFAQLLVEKELAAYYEVIGNSQHPFWKGGE